ncbi:MAG: patatin-like phospholipase family protein [Caulobacterales bacterium]|nr:patatin-like phospholipase family protein [Caulobacterales bacterium]
MTPHPPEAESALARLFAEERRNGRAAWFSVPGGSTLFSAGEPSDQLYFLSAGRLGAFRREEGQDSQFVGLIRPGEPTGEMALIAGSPHSASVVALRDSEVLSLPGPLFFEAANRDPKVMTELARLMILRARQAATHSAVGEPSVFGFIGESRAVAVRELVEAIGQRMEALGYSTVVCGSEALSAPTEWFSNVERDHDFVLYAAEADEGAWRALIDRQVDRLFRVGRGGDPAPVVLQKASAPLQNQKLIDLVLLHPAGGGGPEGSEAWLAATSAARLFHMRQGDEADIKRMARVLTGQSVGLVLSGGGARAYAHIGAIRALREHNVPIDFVGGCSMGAIIAGGLAAGWDDAEMTARIRRAFVDSSPLDDIAFPFIAMIRGQKVRDRLYEHFGDLQIADLWLPFFCVSSNLTTGSYQIHRSGRLRRALRASISLPGVLPPVTQGPNVLVDGAVMKNFPADIMRALQLGPVVGVDVSRGRSIAAEDVKRPASIWKWLLSGEWRSGPPIVSVLMRSATVTVGRDLAASREATDLLITPILERIDLRDWRAFDPAVEAGYVAAQKALNGLNKPVTSLRRRLSHWERRQTAPVVLPL